MRANIWCEKATFPVCNKSVQYHDESEKNMKVEA